MDDDRLLNGLRRIYTDLDTENFDVLDFVASRARAQPWRRFRTIGKFTSKEEGSILEWGLLLG